MKIKYPYTKPQSPTPFNSKSHPSHFCTKLVPVYGLVFRILTRFHILYFGASCIHRNSIVWRRVILARFQYWPEKRKWRISRYSYLMETLISSEYGLTISGHVTVLRQWPLEKNTDYIINLYNTKMNRKIYCMLIEMTIYLCHVYFHFAIAFWIGCTGTQKKDLWLYFITKNETLSL